MANKSIPVLLKVSGCAGANGQKEDTVSLTTMGHYTYGAYPEGEARLTYKETQIEDGETHLIELTFGKNMVTMTRKGPYGTSMVFEPGRRFEGSYRTPFGDLDMALYPSTVRYAIAPEKGDVKLVYQLDLQGQFAAVHELELHFHGRKAN